MIFFLIVLGFTLVAAPIAEGQPVSEFTNDERSQTLFDGNVSHGGYGGLIFGITSVNGQPAFMRGRRGAWILNFSDEHALNLGLGSYRTRNDFNPVEWTIDEVSEPDMRTNYSGFEIEYVNRSYQLVHFSVGSLIGSGNVRYDDRDIDVGRTRDSYFVLQPGVDLNINITNWFRISAGLSYRYASSVNLAGTSNEDLSGVSGILGLRFGGFGI